MATIAMPYSGSAAALCERDVFIQRHHSKESTAVVAGSGGGPVLEIVVELADRRTLKLTVPTDRHRLPDWMSPTLAAFGRVLSLPENWDSYGSPKVRPAIARLALEVLTQSMPNNLNAPAIVPLGDGGIQLEWHRRQQDLELTFSIDEPPQYFYRNRATGEDHEGTLVVSSKLTKLLENLA